MKTLILGGVRSGKSRLAARMAEASQLPVTIIATATAEDEAMRRRIDAHKKERPPHWRVIEEPRALAAALAPLSDTCVIVDCLTLWLTNLLLDKNDMLLQQEIDNLVHQLSRHPTPVILVANETSLGIVPLGELTRQYCDIAGSLHQRLATLCDRVLLTVAGLPMNLKGDPL